MNYCDAFLELEEEELEPAGSGIYWTLKLVKVPISPQRIHGRPAGLCYTAAKPNL
jgi:hypothetical protein